MGRLTYNSKSGWWIGAYSDCYGKRRRRRLARDEDEAREILTAIEGRIIRDRMLGIKPIKEARFRDFADIFMKHCRIQIRAWKRYQTSIRSLTPYFGDAFMTGIDPEMVDKYKQTRAGKVEPGTINRDLQCLKRMFNLGILWGYARDNPVRHVRFLREPAGRVRYLTRDEYRRLLEASPPHLCPVVKVAVGTGCRQGELLGLMWSNVDFENGIISIDETKTATPRKVPMNSIVRAALLELRFKGRGRVFRDAEGQPLAARTLQWQFKRALRDARIDDAVFHDLRHTAASWMAMAGVPLLVVKEVLGHKDVRVTLRYSHLAPDQGFDAVRKLEDFIHSAPDPLMPQEPLPVKPPEADPLRPSAESSTSDASG